MMKKLVSQEQAIIAMIALLAVVLIFHTLVLTGMIPYTIVWAGKIESLQDMKRL